ncbi:ZRSR [Mytilus edulis]|uniref:ZRSR n=1 Tax=Mytilus edulis TaxID=6550 RepID=A0A8S3UWF2_MYTED|nr:ZRSR [Mytilus edulis]
MEKKIKEEWEERQKKETEEKEKEEKRKNKQVKNTKGCVEMRKDVSDGIYKYCMMVLFSRIHCLSRLQLMKTRFNERCSRGHPEPDTSTTILMRGMYSHFELEQGLLDENDTDLILEYEEGELYNNFRDFYDDIVPEFKAVGKVVQVKVCCNYEPHLRGNVYIQFASDEEALAAMVKMNGRFYAGKQISCEPVLIKSWKSAICGLFGRGRCPKGRNCNFLHVFKNPRNEFWEYDKPQNNSYNRSIRSQRSSRSNRSRSRSPYKRSHDRHSYSRDRFKMTIGHRSRSHRYSRSRSRDRHSRSHSRGRRYSRSRSRSRSRSKRKSIERSSSHYSKRKNYEKSRSRERERNRYSRSRSRSQSKAISKDRSVRQVSKQKRSRSRSFSRSRSTSRSPSRHSNKKKKHKHKKSKKHSGSDKSSIKTASNGKIGTDEETSLSKEDSEQPVSVE